MTISVRSPASSLKSEPVPAEAGRRVSTARFREAGRPVSQLRICVRRGLEGFQERSVWEGRYCGILRPAHISLEWRGFYNTGSFPAGFALRAPVPASSIVDKGFFTRAQGSVVDPICCQRCRGRFRPRAAGTAASATPPLWRPCCARPRPEAAQPAGRQYSRLSRSRFNRRRSDSDLTLTGNAQVRRIDGVIKATASLPQGQRRSRRRGQRAHDARRHPW